MGAPVPLRFDFLDGGAVVRTERIVQPIIKIGKLSTSHLRFDDPSVARMHAVIEHRGDGTVELIDLGSSRGTVVNGERIDRRVLKSGDRLEFGGTTVVVYIGDDQPVRAPVTPVQNPTSTGSSTAQAATPAARPQAAAPSPRVASQAAPPAPMGRVEAYYAQRQAALEAQMIAEAASIEVDDDKRHAVEITVIWEDTVQTVEHHTKSRDVLIGGSSRCFYQVDPDDLGADEFPLVKAVGNTYALTFNDRMSGQVRLEDGQTFTLEQLKESGRAIPSSDAPAAFRFLLNDGVKCRIQIRDITFLVNLVPAPRRQAYPWAWRVSMAELGAYGVAVLGWAIFLTLAFLAIPDVDGFRLDSFDPSNRFVSIIVMPEREEEPDMPDWFKEMNKKKEKKPGAKAKGREGKMGKKDSNQTDRRLGIKGPKDNKDIKLRREMIRQKVLKTGALSVLSNPSDELSAIWGRSDRAIGRDAISAVGNWTGASIGSARGFGGLGVAGTGRGGGGFVEGSIGVGTLGTRGRAGGRRNYGRGVGNLGDRSGKIPKVIPGKASVVGSLDREIIRRIIAKHRPEVKYCYEKELVKHKDLMGKVVVTFIIAGTGRVIKAYIKQSTMGNKAVEQCIVSRVKRWKFPQPKGGGIVEVTYPFIFKAT